MFPNRVHNNVIVRAEHAIAVQVGDPHLTVRNNVFIDAIGFRLGGAADPGAFSGILDSDYNFFSSGSAYEAHQEFQLQGSWSLAEMQQSYGQEAHALEGDPMLDVDQDYLPMPASPVLGAGDPSSYADVSTAVNMGRYPFATP